MTSLLSRLPLIGRATEREHLHALLDRALEGFGRLVFIEGEPGIGKSHLIAEALEYAAGRAVTVSRGAADEFERARPFGPLTHALDLDPDSRDRDRAAVALMIVEDASPPTPGGAAISDPAFRITDALVNLVESIVARQPAVLAIEDVHWADLSTLRAISSLGKRVAGLPLLILVSLRPVPHVPELDRLIQGLVPEQADRLQLSPLDHASVEALASEVLGTAPDASLLGLLAGAGGVPLYVIELLEALREEGAIDVIDSRAHVSSVSLPPNLRLTMLRRMTYLPEATLEVLKVASVLGSRFSVAELCALTRKTTVELLSSLDPAIRAGYLGEHGDDLSFRHDLIREAIYDDLPLAFRKQLHHDAVHELPGVGADTLRVAEHVIRSASHGDRAAVEWLRRAASTVGGNAPQTAAVLLEHALELIGGSDPLRGPLLAELLPSLVLAGRQDEAARFASHALDLDIGPGLEGQVRQWQIMALMTQGRGAEAADASEAVLATEGVPPWLRAQCLGSGALGHLMALDVDRARGRAEEALRFAEEIGNDRGIAGCFFALGYILFHSGRWAEAFAVGDKAIAAASRDPLAAQLHPHYLLGEFLATAGRFEEAERVLRDGQRRSSELGTSYALPFFRLATARLRFARGEWDNALAEAEATISLSGEVGTRVRIADAHSLVGRIFGERGDIDKAATAMRAAHEVLATGSPGSVRPFVDPALLQEASDPEAAYAGLRSFFDGSEAVGLFPELFEYAPDLVRLAQANGEPEVARRVMDRIEATDRGDNSPLADATALRCRGLLEEDADALLRSVEVARLAGSPFAAALACCDAAILLASRGETTEARSLAEEATVTFEELGAQRRLASMAAALRPLGIRSGSRTSRRRPTAGWESLTPTEEKTSALVAEGLTNQQIADRLFVSRYTVETHIKHVFAKLGLTSRVQLANVARRTA